MSYTLPIESHIKALAEAGFTIDIEGLKSQEIDAPILDQVALFLSLLGESGVKLTAKGNLPSNIVKEIAQCRASASEEIHLSISKRFIESEQIAVQRVKNLCEVAKLVRVVKGRMILGTYHKKYLKAPQYEQYLYLLEQFSRLNLGYFDGHQEEDITPRVIYLFLQIMRDREASFRGVEVYLAFILEDFPFIGDEIEEHIADNTLLQRDAYEVFEGIVRVRLYQNFFIPFGLVVERGISYHDNYEVEKTALLDRLLLPVNAIEKSKVLDKKRLLNFAKEAKTLGIENLFEDFIYFYMQCIEEDIFDEREAVASLLGTKKLLGNIIKEQELFYTDFAESIKETLRYFTRLEAKGGVDTNMLEEFTSFIDGLYAILPKEKPFNLMKSLIFSLVMLAQNMESRYGIVMHDSRLVTQLTERFDEEVVEDLGHYMMLVQNLEKRLKKAKRLNKQHQESIKEALHAMVLAVMSLHTFDR